MVNNINNNIFINVKDNKIIIFTKDLVTNSLNKQLNIELDDKRLVGVIERNIRKFCGENGGPFSIEAKSIKEHYLILYKQAINYSFDWETKIKINSLFADELEKKMILLGKSLQAKQHIEPGEELENVIE